MYVQGVQERHEEYAKDKNSDINKELAYPLLPQSEIQRIQNEIDKSENDSEDGSSLSPLEMAIDNAIN